MVYYVVYRAPKECKDRGHISRRLQNLGCKRVNRSFWEVNEREVNAVLGVLGKNRSILLKRVRNFRNNSNGELGKLIVVSYKVPLEVRRQKIKRFLDNAPHLRLSRSVYAFFQNHSSLDKHMRLIDARSFIKFIRKIDEQTIVIPRMAVLNPDSVKMLLEETKQRVEKEIDKLIKDYMELYQKAIRGETSEQQVHNALIQFKRRFTVLRWKATFYEKWLKISLPKKLLKPYQLIKKIQSLKMDRCDPNRLRSRSLLL